MSRFGPDGLPLNINSKVHFQPRGPSKELAIVEPTEVDDLGEVVDAEYFEEYKTAGEEIIGEIGQDLEHALNFIRQYQRALDMVGAPDPNGLVPQLLLQKYDMHHKKPSEIRIEVKPKELKAGNDGS